MDIKNLAVKLEQRNIVFEMIEESFNYPVLTFKRRDIEFKFFYRENFIKRSKFHKTYNTFLEITASEKSELLIFKNKIEEMFSCKNCVKEEKIYFNISKIEEDSMIDFINKFKNDFL